MTVDHESRTGKPYEPKRPPTAEERLIVSEKMKEFHRKTGKDTRIGNTMARKARRK